MNDNTNENFLARKRFKSSLDKGDKYPHEEGTEDKVLCSSKAETEAGSYFLGPAIKKCVRSPVTVRLGRKKGTDEYYLMKLLVLDDSNKSDRGLYIRRTVFHNEYTILSLLKNHDGIIQFHDFFKDYIYKEVNGKKEKLKRVGMALECVFPHGPYNSDMIPLNHYLKEEKVTEKEALHILYNLLSVIEKMHKSNVVHREIKLSNIILNRKTLKVKLMDFYYAKVISSRKDADHNKPVVVTCLPKTNDVWAAGVVFYAMLCCGYSLSSKIGSLLSSVRSTQDLYLKLEENKCALLKNSAVSIGAKDILCCTLCSLPQYRLKANEALDLVSTLLAVHSSSHNGNLYPQNNEWDQMVPKCSEFECQTEELQETNCNTFSSVSVPHIQEELDEKEDKEWCQKEAKSDDSAIEDVKPLPCCSSADFLTPSSKECGPFYRDEIKCAMMRLGATSFNSINALSFNYSKKHSCPS